MSAPIDIAPTVADGYERLRGAGAGGAVVGRCALVWVEGPDAETFLQGLVSNDVGSLAPGASRRALLLDAHGHLLADPRVHRDGPDAFTLVLSPEVADAAAGILSRHHFSEDLELLGPEPSDLLTLAGDARSRASALGAVVLDGLVPGTVDVVVDDAATALGDAGLAAIPPEALEMARLEAGVPRLGVDTGPKTLVQEVGLEREAVSFSKGCYLGQETVARAQFRGRVNRRLRGLRLPAAVDAGATVRSGEREVGRATSVAVTPREGAIALAVLRREVEPGDDVAVEGLAAPARVVELPFAPRG